MSQMPVGDPLPAALRQELNDIWRTLRALQEPKHGFHTDNYYEQEVTFSTGGVPVVDALTPRYHIRKPDTYISEVRLTLGTAPSSGSASTTAEIVNSDGDVIHDITHTTNSADDPHHAVDDDLQLLVEEWDSLRVRITQIAAGVEGVTVQVVLMVPEEGE